MALIRAEVRASVLATQACVQQSKVVLAAAQNDTAADFAAEYQQAVADLDRRVAATVAQDNAHLAYAQILAKRFGIDITPYEREREDLEAERDAARRRGDKVGERTADVLIAQNTYNTLSAAGEAITDPAEQERHRETLRAQQAVIEERRAAFEAQLALEARRIGVERGLSSAQASAFEASYVRDGVSRLDDRTQSLAGGDASEAERIQLRAENAAMDSAQMLGLGPKAALVRSLRPEDQAALTGAADTIRNAYGSGANSVDSLDLMSASPAVVAEPTTITLSKEPGAHDEIQPPPVPTKLAAKTGPAVTG